MAVTSTIASGCSFVFASGSTLTLSGSFGGTPTGGTLNLSNVTFTVGTVTGAVLVATQQGSITPVIRSNITSGGGWGIAWGSDGGFNVAGFGSSYLSVSTVSGFVNAFAGYTTSTGGNAAGPVYTTFGESSGMFFGTGFCAIAAAGTERIRALATGVRLTGIPTSSAGLVSGDIWSNLGILTIVP